MANFKITLAYDGTGMVGWQRQAAGSSVQGLIEDALAEIDGRAVTVHGAGRTDAGVHALGQVANFVLEGALPAGTIVRALNARLPDAIRVLRAEEVDPTFHARFSASAKRYRYRIWHADIASPFECAYVWHVPGALDVDAMRRAARAIEGRHDFAAFQAAGSVAATTDREIYTSRFDDSASAGLAPGLIHYEVCGSGFLRHMVRAIVGSLVEIGRGRRDVEWLAQAMASRDRGRAGPTAPASGLFLIGVDYHAHACGSP